jgi:hypothetical protein
MIEYDDEDFKKYRIHVADLATLLDIKRKDFYAAVKLATKKLIGNVLSFEFEKRTIQAAWLASADYYLMLRSQPLKLGEAGLQGFDVKLAPEREMVELVL